MTTRIVQEERFDASPSQVYEILADAERFSAASGGAPIESTPGQRVVQVWRVGTWDPGTYSIVRFEIEGDDDGSTVTLDHAGFPEGQAEHLAQGWHDNYWTPIRAALAAS